MYDISAKDDDWQYMVQAIYGPKTGRNICIDIKAIRGDMMNVHQTRFASVCTAAALIYISPASGTPRGMAG